jgi:hypothetical protein
MFVQVVQGRVADRAELKVALDRWAAELSPGATGWLGTTAGVTADDTFVALTRFACAPDARRNSDRPEQHQWWIETTKLFAGEVSVQDADEVLVLLDGGSDRAGFVQVLQGRTSDPQRLRALIDRAPAHVRAERPDVIGALVAGYGDGDFTEAVYFTSETAARQGERQEDFQERMDRDVAPVLAGIRYFDLPHPWLYSPDR